MALRPEVQRVREELEAVLAPTVATSVLFEAIEVWGRLPTDPQDLAAMVRGPVADLLWRYVGVDEADRIVTAIVTEVCGSAGQETVEVDIDLDGGRDDELATTELTMVPHPVGVLVVGSDPSFAQRMLAAIGPERVHATTVRDEPALRHAAFSATPLLVVLDAAHPPLVAAAAVASALRQLPDSVQAVVWAIDTRYGAEVRDAVSRGAGSGVICLDRADGVEPLFDLVLSRFKRDSTIPVL